MCSTLFSLGISVLFTWMGGQPKQLIFKDAVTYEAPKGDGALTISRDIALDNMGFLYHLDDSGFLTIWDSKGKLTRQIGGKGEGPGEFQMNHGRALMTYNGEFVIVSDLKRFSFFKDGEFTHSIPKPAGVRQLTYFQAIDGDRYLIVYRSYDGKRDQGQLYSYAAIADDSFVPMIELTSHREWAYSKNKQGGWLYQPHAPRLEVAVGSSEIYLAHSNESTIQVYGFNGLPAHKLKTGLTPPEVPDDELDAIKRSFEQWRSSRDTVKFGEYDATIDLLLPLNKTLLVVSQYKLATGLYKGVLLNIQEKAVVGKFAVYLGENGRLFSSNSQLIMSRLDEQGDITLKKVVPILTQEVP